MSELIFEIFARVALVIVPLIIASGILFAIYRENAWWRITTISVAIILYALIPHIFIETGIHSGIPMFFAMIYTPIAVVIVFAIILLLSETYWALLWIRGISVPPPRNQIAKGPLIVRLITVISTVTLVILFWESAIGRGPPIYDFSGGTKIWPALVRYIGLCMLCMWFFALFLVPKDQHKA